MNQLQAQQFEDYRDNRLLFFNNLLDAETSIYRLNEEWLINKTIELKAMGMVDREIYYLTLARINELAIICAGAYAACGELSAAGDLLFNPRLVLVHIKDRSLPVKKLRHTPLTEQFRDEAGGQNIKTWLKMNTIVEVREKPLLVQLAEELGSSRIFTDEHLDSIDKRHREIADTISFICSCKLRADEDFHQYFLRTPQSQKSFIEENICRFDNGLFLEIGRDIELMGMTPQYYSNFLMYSVSHI